MGQLVIVSNRLPITFRTDDGGLSQAEMSAGGLANGAHRHCAQRVGALDWLAGIRRAIAPP